MTTYPAIMDGVWSCYPSLLQRRAAARGDSLSLVGPVPLPWVAQQIPAGSATAGLPGWTSKEMRDGNAWQPHYGKMSDWMTNHNPDNVMILAGGTDWGAFSANYALSQANRDAIHAEIRARLSGLADAALAHDPTTRVFMSSYLQNGYSHYYSSMWYDYYVAMREEIIDIVDERKQLGFDIYFVDIFTDFSSVPGVHVDDDLVHPNAAGIMVMTENFESALYGAVPEPGTMLALGGIGLVAAVRSRRKN